MDADSNDALDIDGDDSLQYLIFKLDERLFKFRGDKMPEGQYQFNFTFTIPANTPSTFYYLSTAGELYSVSY